MKLEERLSEIIEEKEMEINNLQDKVENLENFNSLIDTAYQRQYVIKSTGLRKDLPYPRLEMIFEYISGGRYGYKWTYGMVMKPYSFVREEEFLFIPFSYTRGNGNHENIIKNGKHELPFRDGMNIIAEAIVLNMPAYIINEEKEHVEEIELDESKVNIEAVRNEMQKIK